MVKKNNSDEEHFERDVFISHIQEDADVAIQIAEGLEEEGYSTWYYERDSLPGPSYLIQIRKAINSCRAIVLVISSRSVESIQVSNEVERAYECGKRFIPVLVDISHDQFVERQPLWAQALGTHTSGPVPQEGVDAFIPQVAKGLDLMGIRPHKEAHIKKLAEKRAVQIKAEAERILDVLGGRVAVEGIRMFVCGFKPQTKDIFGRAGIVRECMKLINDGISEFLCLYGSGGIGKSTIAALIFSEFSSEDHQRFERYIWYDLRNEPDPETTLLHLLTIVTGGKVPTIDHRSPSFDNLLNLLRMRLSSHPTLVVFDNLDSTFDPKAEAGTFIDSRWTQMLRGLLDLGSAVIVTSRQLPKFHAQSVQFKKVDGLTSHDSVGLMRNAGLKDSEKILVDAGMLLQGHPMALTALAAAIKRRPSYGSRLERAGDIMKAIRRWPDKSHNPVIFFEEVITLDRMSSFEYAVITSMPVLFRAETPEAIGSLNPDISATDVAFALDELYLRSLVQADLEVDPPLYSLHPLVKEVAETRLEDHAPLHISAYEYYISLPWDDRTTNPNDIEHLRLAIMHALTCNMLEQARELLYGEPALTQKFKQWGRHDLLFPIHLREFEVAGKVGCSLDQMAAAGNISMCMIRLGDSVNALSNAQDALKLAVLNEDKNHECEYQRLIGRIHLLTSNFDESVKVLENALETAIEIRDRQGEGIVRGMLGQAVQKQAKYDLALDYLEKALDISEEFNDTTWEIEWRETIGNIHFLRGDYASALDLFQPSFQLAIGTGDKINEGKLYMLIGRVHLLQGETEQADQHFRKALKISRDIGDRRNEGTLLALMAKIPSRQGNFEEALELFTRARGIKADLGSHAGAAYHEGQIGETYLAMGELDKALEHLHIALDYAVKSKSSSNEGVWRGKIGEVHLRLGDYDTALEWLNKAIDIAFELKDRENENEWYGKIGWLYREKGEYDKACEWLNSALEIAVEIGDPVNERYHRSNLGKCYLATGKPCNAIPQFERVMELIKKLGLISMHIETAERNLNRAKSECGE